MTMDHFRRTLRAELKYTHEEFARHVKQNACTTDSGGCLVRARFQERIRTLNFALEQCGGRGMDVGYQWGPVEGA